MPFHRAFLILIAAGSLGACVVEPRGRAVGYVDIDVAPPPARVVVVPDPRPGYVWVPGYWRWTGSRHEWVDGRWMRERHGRHWEPAHWEQRGNRWHFEEGHWSR